MGIDKFDGIEFGRAKHARRVKTRDGFQQPTFHRQSGFDFMYGLGILHIGQQEWFVMERVMGIDKFDGIEFGRAQHARRGKTRDGFPQPTFHKQSGFDFINA